jgi:hypothetical protein
MTKNIDGKILYEAKNIPEWAEIVLSNVSAKAVNKEILENDINANEPKGEAVFGKSMLTGPCNYCISPKCKGVLKCQCKKCRN